AAMSAAQKKVIDDHCTTEWAGKFADPWADFEHAGLAKVKAEPGHEVYTITDAQLEEWKKSAEPLEKQWTENVRKAGGDPAAIMKELKLSLAQYRAAYCRASSPPRSLPSVAPMTAAGAPRRCFRRRASHSSGA